MRNGETVTGTVYGATYAEGNITITFGVKDLDVAKDEVKVEVEGKATKTVKAVEGKDNQYTVVIENVEELKFDEDGKLQLDGDKKIEDIIKVIVTKKAAAIVKEEN